MKLMNAIQYNSQRQITYFWKFLVLLIGMLITSLSYASIGTVQLLIGQGATYERNQQLQPVQKGLSLQEGDILKTDDQTHIHIKMQDGALISMQPKSELELICYNLQDPKNICIKLNLIEGQIRKISGQASKTSPESFRLNTPVAAVGVRGTDFVTKIQPDRSAIVRVVEGAVTVTPFDNQCRPTGLGDCSTNFTQLLTEADNFMLKVNPMGTLQKIDINQNLVSTSQPTNLAKSETQPTQNEEAGSAFNQVLYIIKDNPDLVEKFLSLSGYEATSDGATDINPDLKANQILFGTWTQNTEGLAQPYEIAKQNRVVTVGDSDFAIWRQNGIYHPAVGQIDYQLKDAHVYIEKPNERINAQVVDGHLSINFDAAKLDTNLLIQPNQGNLINFEGSNQPLRPDGIFTIGDQSQTFAVGAVSNDAKEVGYMINQTLQTGTLKGQTLWHSQ